MTSPLTSLAPGSTWWSMENINQHAEFLPPDPVTRKFSPNSVLPQQNQKEKKKRNWGRSRNTRRKRKRKSPDKKVGRKKRETNKNYKITIFLWIIMLRKLQWNRTVLSSCQFGASWDGDNISEASHSFTWVILSNLKEWESVAVLSKCHLKSEASNNSRE